MATLSSDPIDWGVDEVVAFLCNAESAPWAQSATSARPDPVALEAALRDNVIGGEALLNDVDSNALKHDLGVKALGHRSSLMRAIEWLRLQSPKYLITKKSRSLDELATIDTNTSSLRSTPAPPPFNIVAPSSSKATDPMIPPIRSDKPRRIAPTLVTGSEAHGIRRDATRLAGDQAQFATRGTSLPGLNALSTDTGGFDDVSAEQVNDRQISSHDADATRSDPLEVNRAWFTTALEEDILRRHPPGSDDDDALPVYGDSGSENECDSEEWQEILDEQPHLADEEPDSAKLQPSTHLPTDAVEFLVSQYIEEQKELWEKGSLPKELPYARPLWERSREGSNLKKLTEETSNRLLKLDQSLGKFKKAIFDCQYRSEASVRHSCQCLDQTLAGIFLEKWRLSILEQDTCPPAVDLPLSTPRTRKRRSKSVHSINSMHSEDVASSSESDAWTEHEDMSDFIVEDSDVDMEQSQTERQPGMPFTLASSPSNDGSSAASIAASDAAADVTANDGAGLIEDAWDSPAHKRQRMENGSASPSPKRQRVTTYNEYDDLYDTADVVDLTESNHDSVPVSDLTGASLEQSTAGLDSTLPTEDADAMDVGTPLLNTTSPDSARVSGQSGTSPVEQMRDTEVMGDGTLFLNSTSPDTSQDASVAERWSPVTQSVQSASKLPSSAASPKDDGGLGARPTGEPDDRSLSVNLDDLDLFDTVATLSLKRIELEKHRIHLLVKILMGLTEDELKSYPAFLNKFYSPLYQEYVQQALQAMLNNDRHVEGRDPEESKLAMRMGALFVSWHHCITLQPMESHKHLIQEALDSLIEKEEMFYVFFERFKELVGAARVWRRKSGPSAYPLPAEDEEPERRLMVKFKISKRKRSGGNSALSSQQKEAQERQARQEKAREALRRQREEEGLSNHDPAGQAVTFKEPIIYLHPHIGQLVKPHQLTGIQFMWRELIEADKPQGCLLAHVMGLGKTMQVISFLVTLAAAVASEDPKIREQVPDKFHRFQILVLCPSPVVENWVDEFAIWAPEDHSLGPIREMTPRKNKSELAERVEALRNWNDEGGVIIISYDLLRTLITNRATKLGKPLDDATHLKVQEWLLMRPTIIVADEAHRLKSRESAISKIASSFKTTSRIAMTGSPLANNLSDYYQMVDWAAPGYLEDPIAFKAKFMDPIQDGSYMDSTQAQQRESLVALKLLNGILSPKVLRADVSVIASDLPPKTEFVLCVPLTDLQTRAYNMFVASLAANEAADKLWSWLALLQLCCNHPFPFREKLADRYKPSEASEAGESESGSVLPRSIQDAGLSSDLLPRIEELFSSVSDLRDPYLSNRSLLLAQILHESLNAGDKVLIFSQSIPTIDYLEGLLGQYGFRSYVRIDGSTAGADRQIISKRFNTPEGEKILLISTRAGGVGLNMFGANRVVIFDFLFNPTWEEQAVGRAYRLGQQKPVFVYRFVSGGTFEDIIFNAAVFKSQLAVRVVDKKNIVRESSKQRTRYLFPVRPTEMEDCDAIRGKDPQVLDKILNGSWRECILRVSLSELRDNERDNLTEAERQRVNEALSMELLKRSDPEAYENEMRKRQWAEIQRQRAESHRQELARYERILQEQQAAEKNMRLWREQQRERQLISRQYPPAAHFQQQLSQWQQQRQQQQAVLQDQQTHNVQMDQFANTMLNKEKPLPLRPAPAGSSPKTVPSALPAPRDGQITDCVSGLPAPTASGDNTVDLTSEPLDMNTEEMNPPAPSTSPSAPPTNPSAPPAAAGPA